MSTAATAISLPATANPARIYGKEAKYEFVKLLRTRSFSLATIGFPVMFYIIFGLANRHAFDGGVHMAKYMLAGYACFGLIGSALFGIGVGLSSDLAAGWLELKRSSPMPVAAYLFAKCASAVAFGIIIVTILTIIGRQLRRRPPHTIRAGKDARRHLRRLHQLRQHGPAHRAARSRQRRTRHINLIYLPMSFLSGLWVPIKFMPHWLQGIAPLLPTYHLSQIMLSVFHYNDTMSLTTHWNALIGFTLVMLGISRLIFHRKEQNA